ncbi:MAG TPA: DUF2851 domain-containing protein, partial [Algoriphagus sp.]|nr:DUF2851 domain-containing protein [Algoriphagus sp.]
LILKHRTQLPAIESMLFGLAGLLPESSDEPYPSHLIKEYDFLRQKYQWNSPLKRQHWNF